VPLMLLKSLHLFRNPDVAMDQAEVGKSMRLFWIRRDLLAVLLGLAFVAIAVAIAMAPRSNVGNSGFGPGRSFTNAVPGYSEPICIKNEK
jgi:hypothetical protein